MAEFVQSDEEWRYTPLGELRRRLDRDKKTLADLEAETGIGASRISRIEREAPDWLARYRNDVTALLPSYNLSPLDDLYELVLLLLGLAPAVANWEGVEAVASAAAGSFAQQTDALKRRLEGNRMQASTAFLHRVFKARFELDRSIRGMMSAD